MITMKFGGTSVGDLQRLRDVVSIVRSHLSLKPLVVASAMSGVTDMLLETAQLAVRRENARVEENIKSLTSKHFEVASSLIEDAQRRKELSGREIALFKDGTLVDFVPRFQIESRDAFQIAQHLQAMFENHCAPSYGNVQS